MHTADTHSGPCNLILKVRTVSCGFVRFRAVSCGLPNFATPHTPHASRTHPTPPSPELCACFSDAGVYDLSSFRVTCRQASKAVQLQGNGRPVSAVPSGMCLVTVLSA